MAILWFGQAKTLDSLKPKALKKERLVQEVQRDQLSLRMKQAQDERDGFLDAASEPGLTKAERQIAAYKMDLALKRKSKAESDFQGVITRMQVIDSTLDILNHRSELERKGVWNTINEMSQERLQQQLEEFAVERKEGELNVNRIAEMMEIDTVAVQAHRSPGFRQSLEAIEEAASKKLDS